MDRDNQEDLIDDVQEAVVDDAQEVVVDDAQEAVVDDAQEVVIDDAQEAVIDDAQEVVVIDTHLGAQNGQSKCPKCGATDIALNIESGKLRCRFCRHEFEAILVEGIEQDLDKLTGVRIGSGAQNIDDSQAAQIITLKCQSCGADVMICADESPQARCHWCRNTLSINNAVPNGAVPDIVLPFALSKEQSQLKVSQFIRKRWFFAHPRFKKEFTVDNIFGVYFPYMIVDIRASTVLQGVGEVLVRKYTVTRGSGKNKRRVTYYDADAYILQREFDITINDLTVESSQDKLNHQGNSSSKNVINAILPFDTENAVKWDANYLKGFRSEKRDVDIDGLREIVDSQARDIACNSARATISQYNRGVRWDEHQQDVLGEQWVAAHLPVWIYSYQKEAQGKLFYTAVNARTGETMGSVPLNYLLLSIVSLIIFMLSLIPALLVEEGIGYICLIAAPLFAYLKYSKYTNKGERHNHEEETQAKMKNLKAKDCFYERRTRLSSDEMKGATCFTYKK